MGTIRVEVELKGPLARLAGKEQLEYQVKSSTLIRDLLGLIGQDFPALQKFLPGQEGEQYGRHRVLILQEGQPVKLDQKLFPGMRLKIMPPLTGG